MRIKRRRIEGKLGAEGIEYCGGGESLKMVSGAFYIPKENSLTPQGEDAHFICEGKQTIGVADGVGGWARKGIDAGEYARELMENSVNALRDEPKGAVNPIRVLREAYCSTMAKGSSTACIITLNANYLHAVNVGDSGFMVFRDNELVYKSPMQQHRFNCPYQLGNCTRSDGMNLAEELEVAVEPGDIVVAGTDGLFDNMYPSEIEELMGEIEGGFWPEQLAWTIAESALFNSHDKQSHTPFKTASLLAGFDHVGGKVDDITVIVALIESL